MKWDVEKRVDIDKLLELESKATSRDWTVLDGGTSIGTSHDDICFADIKVKEHSTNMELICLMKANIRKLCIELKAARKVVEAAREFSNSWLVGDDLISARNFLIKRLEELDEVKGEG